MILTRKWRGGRVCDVRERVAGVDVSGRSKQRPYGPDFTFCDSLERLVRRYRFFTSAKCCRRKSGLLRGLCHRLAGLVVRASWQCLPSRSESRRQCRWSWSGIEAETAPRGDLQDDVARTGANVPIICSGGIAVEVTSPEEVRTRRSADGAFDVMSPLPVLHSSASPGFVISMIARAGVQPHFACTELQRDVAGTGVAWTWP